MKLARIGTQGREIPVVIDGDTALDVRSITDDYNPTFLANGGVARLRDHLEARRDELPRLPSGSTTRCTPGNPAWICLPSP